MSRIIKHSFFICLTLMVSQVSCGNHWSTPLFQAGSQQSFQQIPTLPQSTSPNNLSPSEPQTVSTQLPQQQDLNNSRAAVSTKPTVPEAPQQSTLTQIKIPKAIPAVEAASPTLAAEESSAQPLEIRLFRSYGHEKLVHISGRIVRPEEQPPVSADDSKWTNFWRNLQELSVNEVTGVKVRFSLNGHTLTLTSNDEGMLLLSTAAFGVLAPGEHELKAELLAGQAYSASPATTTITIHSQADTSPSLVSDIDDTLVKTQVSDKLQAMKNFLLDNSLSSDLIPGTAELYQALEKNFDGKVDGDIFYLSGSPLNFADRIYQLLDTHAYPTGAVTLKKWGFEPGDDNPIQQNGYKQKALRKLLLTYPNKPFYFFGDSGELDPEIYSEIAAEFPKQVKAIFINNVTGEQPDQERFQGVHLTRHTVDAAQILLAEGLLSAADVSRVHKALLVAAAKPQDD